jgi:sRNA-binding carbon storage regulator CsrA
MLRLTRRVGTSIVFKEGNHRGSLKIVRIRGNQVTIQITTDGTIFHATVEIDTPSEFTIGSEVVQVVAEKLHRTQADLIINAPPTVLILREELQRD